MVEDSLKALRLVTVDEVGLVKVAEGPASNVPAFKQVSTWGKPEREQGIERLAASHAAEPSDAGLIAVARRGGAVQLLQPATGAGRGEIPACSADADASAVRGLHFLPSHPQAPDSSAAVLLTCAHSGAVRVHACGADGAWAEVAAWQGPANVLATALDGGGARLAFGCEGSQLQVWDVAKAAAAFQARAPRPSAIGLKDRPANTAVAFLPGAEERIVVGTAHHKLALFQPSQGKRPRFVSPFREARVTALAPEADGTRCWAADAKGEIGCLDIARQQVLAVIKGPAGAIRALAIHPRLPLMASAGLDRFLRVHDLASRKCLARLYLKQQLTGVAWASPPAQAAEPASLPGSGGERDGSKRAAAEVPAADESSAAAKAPRTADPARKKRKQQRRGAAVAS